MPCVKLGPGPGAYKLPTETGYNLHDCSKYRNPAYSFGLKSQLINKSRTPGPVYNVDKFTEHGPTGVPSYSIAKRLNELRKFNVPGPGTYNVEKVPPMNESRPPAYSIKARTGLVDKRVSPGPAAYMLPTTLGPNVPDKYRFAAYKIAGRLRGISAFQSPGPAQYGAPSLKVYKNNNPEYSITPRIRGPNTNMFNPGPAGYLPKFNSKNSPAFSFGVRHSECAPPYILPIDGE